MPLPRGVGLTREAFRLPAHRSSAGTARRRVRQWLERQEVTEDACHTAQLVMSELFSNAVVHTRSTSIACVLVAHATQLRIEVRDQGDGVSRPTTRDADAADEHGRGLLLVESLTDAWGVIGGEQGEGRTVWASLITGPQ